MPTSPPVETNLVVGNWDGLPVTFGNEVDHLFLLVKVALGFCFVFCYELVFVAMLGLSPSHCPPICQCLNKVWVGVIDF